MLSFWDDITIQHKGLFSKPSLSDFLFWKNEDNLINKSHHCFLKLLPVSKWKILLVFFIAWVIFWNTGWPYFHLFFIQQIENNIGVKWSIFFEGFFPIFSINPYWKHLSSLLIEFVVALLFFIQLGDSICDPIRLKLILRHLQYNSWTESNIKLLPLIGFSKPIWYLDSKVNQQIHLHYIINSAMLLFECVTRSSSASLEEIKLIAIVNWIFHMPDFWRSIITSLK